VAVTRDLTEQYERWIMTPEGLYFDEKLKELMITCLHLKTGEKVLQVGSGTGRYLRYMQELGLDPCGIEPVEELNKLARRKEGITDKQAISGYAEKLPFQDCTFDSVIFMSTFEYVDDKSKALLEAFRVSRGKIGIGFLNRTGVTNLLRQLNREGLYTDAEFFTAKELRKLCEKTPLNEIENIEITVKHSVYLPLRFAHYVQWVDDLLEKINIPFGNYGMLVIKKKKGYKA